MGRRYVTTAREVAEVEMGGFRATRIGAVVLGALCLGPMSGAPIGVAVQLALAQVALAQAAMPQPIPLPPKRPAPPAARPPAAAANEAVTRPVFVRPGDPVAYDGSQRAVVDRVSAYLSSVQTLIGDFVQIGPDGGRTTGKFYIQKPGKVRFDYEPPSLVDVVADGSSVVVRDRRLATQDLYPLSQTPLRFLLADQLDLLRDTNVVAVSRDKDYVSVTIEERQLLVGTHRLVLTFNAKDMQLRQWTVTDPQGYDTTVAIYNLDTVHRPDPNLFRIIYERVLQ
jgi:outer membrane lipoprotein-sorting protein